MAPRTPEPAVARREVLSTGGAAAVSELVAGRLGAAPPPRAPPVAGGVPAVDRRVVTDSYHLALAPRTTVNGVAVLRYGSPVSAQPPRQALVSEFGVSLHLESQRGGEVRHILLDFGYTPETLTNNREVFGVPADKLDALVLSHGHYAHSGGLVGCLRANTGKLKAHIPLYLGREACFCTRERTIGGQVNHFGVLDRQALAEANVAVTFAEGPARGRPRLYPGPDGARHIRARALAHAPDHWPSRWHRLLPGRVPGGEAHGPGDCRPIRSPAPHLLPCEGAWPGRPHLVRAPRGGEFGPACHGGVRPAQGACGGGASTSPRTRRSTCARPCWRSRTSTPPW